VRRRRSATILPASRRIIRPIEGEAADRASKSSKLSRRSSPLVRARSVADRGPASKKLTSPTTDGASMTSSDWRARPPVTVRSSDPERTITSDRSTSPCRTISSPASKRRCTQYCPIRLQSSSEQSARKDVSLGPAGSAAAGRASLGLASLLSDMSRIIRLNRRSFNPIVESWRVR
jgi:hypothetical protein